MPARKVVRWLEIAGEKSLLTAGLSQGESNGEEISDQGEVSDGAAATHRVLLDDVHEEKPSQEVASQASKTGDKSCDQVEPGEQNI